MAMENEAYVGFKANIRELAVPVPGGRCSVTCRVDVHQSLVLADDLFRHRAQLSGSGTGRATETA